MKYILFFLLIGAFSLQMNANDNELSTNKPRINKKQMYGLKKRKFVKASLKVLGQLSREISHFDIYESETPTTFSLDKAELTKAMKNYADVTKNIPLTKHAINFLSEKLTLVKDINDLEDIFDQLLQKLNDRKWLKKHYDRHSSTYYFEGEARASDELVIVDGEIFESTIKQDFNHLILFIEYTVRSMDTTIKSN